MDVGRPTVGANEDAGAHGLDTEGFGDPRGCAEVGQQRRAALDEEASGHRLLDQRGMDLAGVDRAHETAFAQAHEVELGDADAGAGEEPAEPDELGRTRRRHGDAQPLEVLDRAHAARMRRGDEHREWRGRREPEHQAGRLVGGARAEAQQRLERRRGEIHLALGQRLGGAGLGAGRPDRDLQPLAREVALGLGHPDR